jgi:ABC-2 type transport system permease protein
LLIVFAIAALWLAGKAFRLGMLRYGKKLTLKEIFTQRQ